MQEDEDKTTFWQTNENSTLNFEPLWASFISPLKVCNKLNFFSIRWQISLQDIKKHSFHNPSNKKNIYKFYLKCWFCFQNIKLSCHVFCPAGNECMRSSFLNNINLCFLFHPFVQIAGLFFNIICLSWFVSSSQTPLSLFGNLYEK